jgi:hypothetical protein
MALLANDRNGLEVSQSSVSWGRKIMPALEGPAVWSPLAIKESPCTRGLSYWVALLKGPLRGRQRGSLDGNG